MKDEFRTIICDKWILSNRGKKNRMDPRKPYAWLIEKERTISGKIEDTAIIFLTNCECPFHCLMCDLWKNTTDAPVAAGMIPGQIRRALQQMPPLKHIKIYNSGSFFDKKAVPEEDYPEIASLLSSFEVVIVESHPKFIGERTLSFKNLLKGELQVAIGLETVNPDILQLLNKQMTTQDFHKAVFFLSEKRIPSRAFILLKPPFLNESQGVYWAERSLDFAFSSGVECCVVIPVRPGNGAMDVLMKEGEFYLPEIHSLEKVIEYGIRLNAGRVFADLWDLDLFSGSDPLFFKRVERLKAMNLSQQIL